MNNTYTNVGQQMMQLVLGTASNTNTTPYHVDYVRVWQTTATG
jgi:hypothetical protein